MGGLQNICTTQVKTGLDNAELGPSEYESGIAKRFHDKFSYDCLAEAAQCEFRKKKKKLEKADRVAVEQLAHLMFG